MFLFLLTENELRGQVVWVTGASSGIGEELAYQLAKIGSLLVLSARREDELERVKKKCLGRGFHPFKSLQCFLNRCLCLPSKVCFHAKTEEQILACIC